jgi:hypothetical protein
MEYRNKLYVTNVILAIGGEVDMKKFFGIAVLLYALLAVGSGLSLNPIQWSDLLGDDGPQAGDVGDIQPGVDTREWHAVATFESDNQTNQRTTTSPFYIEGDEFRIGYVILTEPPEGIGSEYSSTFDLVVKKVADEENTVAGRCEEGSRPQIVGSLPVEAGSGYYYLSIWSVNCSEWEVMVESLH